MIFCICFATGFIFNGDPLVEFLKAITVLVQALSIECARFHFSGSCQTPRPCVAIVSVVPASAILKTWTSGS